MREIGFGTNVVEVNAELHAPEALPTLQHVDVIFSCVDGHGARLILNRYAYAHLAVVIDLAVLVTVTDDATTIDERVTWIGPTTAKYDMQPELLCCLAAWLQQQQLSRCSED